jgi:hypothetical protein
VRHSSNLVAALSGCALFAVVHGALAGAPTEAPVAKAAPAHEESGASKTTWYEPKPDDPRLPEKESGPSARSAPLNIGVAYDIRGFVSGRPEGTAHEIRALVGKGLVAGSLGIHIPSARIGLGVEIGRHWGIPLGVSVRRSELFLAWPTCEPRLLLSPSAGDQVWKSAVLAIGTSGFGLRAARLPFVLEIRLPTLHIFGMPFNGRGSAAVAAGAALVAYYGL